jgi:NADH:ubiquinone oxidoreductase subunit K
MEPKLSLWAVLVAFFVLMVTAATVGVTLGLLISIPPPL